MLPLRSLANTLQSLETTPLIGIDREIPASVNAFTHLKNYTFFTYTTSFMNRLLVRTATDLLFSGPDDPPTLPLHLLPLGRIRSIRHTSK